jgi:uncharacterized RDD family membrane protein YckC
VSDENGNRPPEVGEPIAPPSSPVPEFRTMLGMAEGPEPAGRGRRFGTFIVDILCYYVVAFVFGLVLAVAVFIGYGPNVAEVVHAIPRWKLWIVGCIDIFVYYTLFEGIFARTPGKLVFGTKVVSEAGEKPTPRQVLGRSLCRFIPFDALSFLLDERGWHDKIPGTYVVAVPKKK